MRITTFASAFAALLAVALASEPAHAASVCKKFNCLDILYYSNAKKEKVVGVRSTCPGRKGLRGRATPWSDREPDSYEICTSTPPKIPCEFKPGGCTPGATLQKSLPEASPAPATNG